MRFEGRLVVGLTNRLTADVTRQRPEGDVWQRYLARVIRLRRGDDEVIVEVLPKARLAFEVTRVTPERLVEPNAPVGEVGRGGAYDRVTETEEDGGVAELHFKGVAERVGGDEEPVATALIK